MEHTSKPTGCPSDFYALGLVIAGVILWVISSYQKSFTALYQLIAVVMFGAAMYLLIRYRLTVFRFRIEGLNGATVDISTAMAEELDFVVEKLRGKTGVALARLSLDKLRRAEIIPYSSLKEVTAKASLFRYHADMSPEEGMLLVFKNEGRDIAIFTTLPDDMSSFLKKIVGYNLTDSMD